MNNYYGFTDGLHPEIKKRVIKCLSGRSIDSVGKHTIASDVVEELVRRGSKFYTAQEARPVAPFNIKYDDTFCASYRRLENEPIPTNPAFAEKDWCVLVVTQYCYGIYLSKLVNEGRLTIDELINTAQSYV